MSATSTFGKLLIVCGARQSWNRVIGSPGQWLWPGRVGTGFRSKLWTGPVLWPGSGQNNRLIHFIAVSSVRPLAPSKCALIAYKLVLLYISSFAKACCAMLLATNNPPASPPHPEQIRGEQVCDLQSLYNTNFYDRSCCTSRCKAPVANLSLVHSC